MKEISELDAKFLATFPEWLKSLADDARALARVVCDAEQPAPARAQLAAGLNYLLKSVDLIADGIEDLGYLDDAFVLRVAVHKAKQAELGLGELPGCERLSSEADVVLEFLGDEQPRLDAYVDALAGQAVRGRSPGQIAEDAELAAQLQQDIGAWADAYQSPGFSPDEKNLVKLRAFMNSKLPRAE